MWGVVFTACVVFLFFLFYGVLPSSFSQTKLEGETEGRIQPFWLSSSLYLLAQLFKFYGPTKDRCLDAAVDDQVLGQSHGPLLA